MKTHHYLKRVTVVTLLASLTSLLLACGGGGGDSGSGAPASSSGTSSSGTSSSGTSNSDTSSSGTSSSGTSNTGTSSSGTVKVTQLTMSSAHTCALKADGGVRCWGQRGSVSSDGTKYGLLGDGSEFSASASGPVDVKGLTSGVLSISAGYFHTCAITASGVKCWGNNDQGQLGDGSLLAKNEPTGVTGLISNIASIATASESSCALTKDGAVKCWGSNKIGAVGNSASFDQHPVLSPANVAGLTSGVNALSTSSQGLHFMCAHKTAPKNEIRCWGANGRGQLGDSGTISSPTPTAATLNNASKVTAISQQVASTCVLMDGRVKCWGSNSFGNLGTGNVGGETADARDAIDVIGLKDVAAIASGGHHACALTSAGGVKCWGLNTSGELGDGSAGPWSPVPVDVLGLSSGVVAIAAGPNHTCAAMAAGGVKCWGRNDFNQLGNGKSTNSSTPVDVVGL